MNAVLQICQNYHQPFLDCTRQYAALFNETDITVVTVFICGEENQQAREEVGSGEVIFLEHHRSELDGLKIGITRELREISKRYDFKACIAHRNKPTYLALMATKLPVISIHHAFNDFNRLGRRVMAKFFRERLTLLAVSNAVRDQIRHCFPLWPDSKIFTLYNRVNAETLRNNLLSQEEARRTLNLAQDAYIIGNVGRLHPDKDQKTLIEGFAKALKKLPERSYLCILGKGKSEKVLRHLATELGITDKVIFTGQIQNAKSLFRAFDLFVLSSNQEPFGMVLLEAMVADVPIISTNCGGAVEVVDGAGHLFDFGNAAQLSELIMKDYQLRTSINSTVSFSKHLTRFSDESAKLAFWSEPEIKTLFGR